MTQEQFIPILESAHHSIRKNPLYFFHGYDPQYWDGLAQKGFLDSHSGVKITQTFSTPSSLQFNEIASIQSPLNHRIQSEKLPLYIDRLQGGAYYYHYPFDSTLLQYYTQFLGDQFLGIQFHEWASNFRDDWIRIAKLLRNVPKPWTAQQIHDGILSVSKDPANINLSSGFPELFATLQEPTDLTTFLHQLSELYQLRQKESSNLLVPADSYFMAPKMEIESGARILLPEVGAQIPLTRIQIALTRGMASLYYITWGAYYECWGGKPFSVSFARKDGINEWYVDQDKFDFNFTSFGETGGSSRALQRRIFYFLLMSGAHYLAEEWGVGNTFYDWDNFSLTEYGQIKHDFIQFSAKYQNDIPSPFVPFGIILPDDFPILDISFLSRKSHIGKPEKYLDYPITEDLHIFHLKIIKRVLMKIFGSKKSVIPHYTGSESSILTNSGFPDFFDIIYLSPKLDKKNLDYLTSRYLYLIDLTFGALNSEKYGILKSKIITIHNFTKIDMTISSLIKTVIPVRISGNVHWMINWDGQSNLMYLTLFNNHGVERKSKVGDLYHESALITTYLDFRLIPSDIEVIKSWPDKNTVERIRSTRYKCRIHAGGMTILRIVLSKKN